jgi:hypothetical protein
MKKSFCNSFGSASPLDTARRKGQIARQARQCNRAINPRPHGRRPRPRHGEWRPAWPQAHPYHHQKQEAIKRVKAGKETQGEIACEPLDDFAD